MRDWMVERLISAKDKGKKDKRATCRYDLEGINRSNNNCPIVLKNMTFNIFSDYMSTKKSQKFRGYLSATSYGGVQNHLTHLYLMIGKTMNRELKNNYLI